MLLAIWMKLITQTKRSVPQRVDAKRPAHRRRSDFRQDAGSRVGNLPQRIVEPQSRCLRRVEPNAGSTETAGDALLNLRAEDLLTLETDVGPQPNAGAALCSLAIGFGELGDLGAKIRSERHAGLKEAIE